MACRSAVAGKNGIGPSLAGVFGRKSGSRTTTLARTDTASQQALDEATNEEAAARVVVAEIGENVRAGQPVLAISAAGKQWLSFNVREDYLRDLTVGAVVRVTRSGSHEPMPAVVTELRPLGSFATWQAERAIGDHDRNTLRLRLDPQNDASGLETGMTVWLSR